MSISGTSATSQSASDPDELRIGPRWPIMVALMLASAVIMVDTGLAAEAAR
jgi:hypothetical protein